MAETYSSPLSRAALDIFRLVSAAAAADDKEPRYSYLCIRLMDARSFDRFPRSADDSAAFFASP